jgi:hypothetical protein
MGCPLLDPLILRDRLFLEVVPTNGCHRELTPPSRAQWGCYRKVGFIPLIAHWSSELFPHNALLRVRPHENCSERDPFRLIPLNLILRMALRRISGEDHAATRSLSQLLTASSR